MHGGSIVNKPKKHALFLKHYCSLKESCKMTKK